MPCITCLPADWSTYWSWRENGRRIVEVDPVAAANVKRMFHLYAYENQTIEGIIRRFAAEGIVCRPDAPRWRRNSMTTRSGRCFENKSWRSPGLVETVKKVSSPVALS